MDEKIIRDNNNQIWSETDPFTNERYLQISTYIKGNKISILEIGCNTGRGGVVIRGKFPDAIITGVDIVKSRLDHIAPNIYNHLTDKDITQWDNSLERFDYILVAEVIEHIPKTEFSKFLLKCKELLKENGKIIITTPNPNSVLVKLGKRAVFKDPSHINLLGITDFKYLIKMGGLKVERIVGSGKMTRYIKKSPFMSLYGSYLAILSK